MRNIELFFTIFFSIFWGRLLDAQEIAPSSIPDRIILNLTENSSISMAVTWRTDTTVSEGLCEVQLAPEGPIDIKKSKIFKAKTTKVHYEYSEEPKIVSNHHSCLLTELESGKQYIYRVGSQSNWSEWFQFKTPSDQNSCFSFIYFGDPQSNLKSQWSRVIRGAFQHDSNCGFMLYAGDLINRAGKDSEWYEWFLAGSFIYGMIPQVMTPGNHDYNGLTLDPHWNAQFTLPTNGPKGLEGTCFFIDYNNLRLISIDSAADSELKNENGYMMTAQKSWLDSVLQTNTKKWVIITTHLPFYSSKENRDNKFLRKHFQPILEKHKVDLVLSGHDHAYARGRATDNPSNNHKVMYVVSVSGPKMYKADNKDWMEHFGSFKQLYQVITIDNNELVYESFTTDGQLFDTFILKK